MGRYQTLWEVDQSFVPLDAAERLAGWGLLLDMVKQDMEKGLIKEWGAFAGELKGFGIFEGTVEEVHQMVIPYSPFVTFEVHQVISQEKVKSIVTAMSG